MNGFQTQGENIADNGGLKESFRVNIWNQYFRVRKFKKKFQKF